MGGPDFGLKSCQRVPSALFLLMYGELSCFVSELGVASNVRPYRMYYTLPALSCCRFPVRPFVYSTLLGVKKVPRRRCLDVSYLKEYQR